MKKHLPFGYQEAEDSPGFLLWQVTVLWQRAIKKVLDEHQIPHAQFVILAVLLWCLYHQKEVTQTVIIDFTKLDKMTVSKSLKQLEIVNSISKRLDKDNIKTVNNLRAVCLNIMYPTCIFL